MRQALQHVAAIGAFSPYFAAAWEIRPCQIVFTTYMLPRKRPEPTSGSKTHASQMSHDPHGLSVVSAHRKSTR